MSRDHLYPPDIEILFGKLWCEYCISKELCQEICEFLEGIRSRDLLFSLLQALAESAKIIELDAFLDQNPFRDGIIDSLYPAMSLAYIANAQAENLKRVVRLVDAGSIESGGQQVQLSPLTIDLAKKYLAKHASAIGAAGVAAIIEPNEYNDIEGLVQELYMCHAFGTLVQQCTSQWAVTPGNRRRMVAAATHITIFSRP